jgi:hypothetical protein
MNSHLLQVGESAVVVRPAGLPFLRPSMLSSFSRVGGAGKRNDSGACFPFSEIVPPPCFFRGTSPRGPARGRAK